jgi:hypothetical protein
MIDKITFIIAVSFAFFAYAEPSKVHFDLCIDVFISYLLFSKLETVIREKNSSFAHLIIIVICAFLYAIVKEILGLGTEYVFSDYVMWILIPSSIVGVLIIDIIKYLKNESK